MRALTLSLCSAVLDGADKLGRDVLMERDNDQGGRQGSSDVLDG